MLPNFKREAYLNCLYNIVTEMDSSLPDYIKHWTKRKYFYASLYFYSI